VGAATLVVGATTVFAELRRDLDIIWRAPPPAKGGVLNFLKTRALSFSMVMGAGLLLLGSLLSTVLVIRRSPSSIAALGLTAVVASGVVAGLSSRPNRVSPLLGKWIVIAAAALAAVPLVAEASGR